MAGTLASVLLLICPIALILVLLIALDRAYPLPFLNPSRQDVRDLLIALEDLLLPMGSFLSEVLHTGPPDHLSHDSNPATIRLSTTSAPGSTTPGRKGDSLPPKPTSDDGGVKLLTTTPLTVPTPNDNASELVVDSAAVQQVSTGTQTTEQQDGDSTAATEDVPTESQAFEQAIRGLVDPEGASGSNLENLVNLVVNITQRRAEAEEKLKSETVRFQRAEEDLRHGWEDSREIFERVINGQNEKVQEKLHENNELYQENWNLKAENDILKAEREGTLEEHNRVVKRLNNEKEYAEEAERTAKKEVEGRINRQKRRYEKEKTDAAFQHLQESNSLICKQRMVRDELMSTRNDLISAAKQHEAALKKKDRAIQGLQAEIRRMEPAVAAAEERAAIDIELLEKQLEDQRTRKNEEIGNLRNQLREVRDEVRSLTKSLGESEATAKWEKLQSQRLSDRLDEETTRLREDKEYIVADLKLDIRGLKRTIKANALEITRLEGRTTQLESGEEVQGLRSQLQVSKEQARKSAKDAKDSKEQLKIRQREMEGLQRTLKAQEDKSSEEAQKASKKDKDVNMRLKQAEKLSKENEALKEQLEQAGKLSKENEALKEQLKLAEKLSKGNEALKEQLKLAEQLSKENEALKEQLKQAEQLWKENEALKEQLKQAARAASEGQNEKAQEFGEQKNELSRKLGIAQSAEQTVRTEVERLRNESRETAMEHERTIKQKDDEIRRLQQENQQKDDEIRRLQQENLEKTREAEREQQKAAVERAAKEATEAARLTLQKQLTDERHSLREAQKKATETEISLRNQMSVLRSQVHRVAESQNIDPVGSQASNETQGAALLRPQVGDGMESQVDAMLGRRIRKPRSLKQQAKPASAMLSSHPAKGGQPQQTPISVSSAPSPGVKRDTRQSFADIMAAVSSPQGSDDATTAARREQAVKAPLGWTDEMTETVKAMQGEETAFIEETVKGVHGFVTEDTEGLEKWLQKLESDFRA